MVPPSKAITEKEKAYMNDKFFNILDEIYQLKDEKGNEFSYAFHALPLRANLEYYKVIKNPMSYSKIRMASKHKRYTHPQAFINELSQITWNARFFNEESSEFYKFAIILDNYIKNTIIPDLKNDINIFKHDEIFYPNLGSLPKDQSNNNTPSPQVKLEQQEKQQQQQQQQQEPQQQNHQTPLQSQKQQVQQPPQQKELTESKEVTPVVQTPNENVSTPMNEEDDEEEDFNETKHEHEFNNNENDLKILNQSYNPTSYVSTIEDTGKSHEYIPPKAIKNFSVPDRQILEQWVKRGRPPIVDKPHEQRIKSIMRGLKKIKVGNKTIVSFWDKLPSQQDHPDYLKVVKDPITMLDIKSLIKQRYYKTVDAYVSDVFKLITNNRAYFINDEFIKNNLNILEANISRLYQIEMSKPDVDYMSGQQTTKFPLSQVEFNDRIYKVGNWILVNNPNDQLRPIVAQIFRLWQRDDGELCMNVCWYYRPEWTVHRVDRLFLDNEVVKTGQYRDHLVSEIVGPCYVAYFTRWLKGDPGLPFEGPLFVCEFRYNDKENTFAKIRTWKACLPDEVRHIEDPIKPLTTNRILKKYPSPIKNLLAPGSTSTSPIPQPTILNLNSPPLVGAVYVPRVNDEIDPHYFDNSLTETQCKSYVPPTNNIRIPASSYIDDNHDINHNKNLNSNSSSSIAILNQLKSHNNTQFMPISTTNSVNNFNLKKSTLSNPNLTSSFKSYSTINNSNSITNIGSNLNKSVMNFHPYSGSTKVIKSPYNLITYAFSQFHSPSSSFSFVRFNGAEEKLPDLIKSSYARIDKHNSDRINKNVRLQQTNMGSSFIEINNKLNNQGIKRNSLIWFRGPPVKVIDRILADDYDSNDNNNNINNGSVGIKRIRCGHSAEYIAWKLKKQKK